MTPVVKRVTCPQCLRPFRPAKIPGIGFTAFHVSFAIEVGRWVGFKSKATFRRTARLSFPLYVCLDNSFIFSTVRFPKKFIICFTGIDVPVRPSVVLGWKGAVR
jgi:hypothetical protein